MFRSLAYEYLGRNDLVHVLDKPEVQNTGNEEWDINTPTIGDRIHELSEIRVLGTVAPVKNGFHAKPLSGDVMKKADTDIMLKNAAAKKMQSDAPACNQCGNIMIRSGACYKCDNCGNQGGCG